MRGERRLEHHARGARRSAVGHDEGVPQRAARSDRILVLLNRQRELRRCVSHGSVVGPGTLDAIVDSDGAEAEEGSIGRGAGGAGEDVGAEQKGLALAGGQGADGPDPGFPAAAHERGAIEARAALAERRQVVGNQRIDGDASQGGGALVGHRELHHELFPGQDRVRGQLGRECQGGRRPENLLNDLAPHHRILWSACVAFPDGRKRDSATNARLDFDVDSLVHEHARASDVAEVLREFRDDAVPRNGPKEDER